MTTTPTNAKIAAAFTPAPGKSRTVTLDTPLVRENGNTISELTLRKPKSGELRGLKIPDIVAGDADTIIALLPRIAHPTITASEAEQLDFDDIAEITGALLSFLETKMKTAPASEAPTPH
ncbi:phage tail assembly protein [Novosphingobium sp. KACC 22771]|uniref:phage tail assembly protein n=1 Tax=Novosphingobium sp. KACC 22771 TaxID=3025670 RepID=UPI00236738D2|nr:phage tail assembly protein [Novosphingobium sp. KACC 22771]WDF71492.1 phage tail assembly protein [Novosphingobium sp. KACC 22771]